MLDSNQKLTRFLKPFSAWRRAAAGKPPRRRMVAVVGLALLGLVAAAPGQSSGVYREVYTSLSGNSLSSLTNDTTFPNSPTPPATILTNGFEAPQNVLDHYGQRCRALIVPPITGNYVFWLAANYSGALSVSSDESPFNKAQIAYQDIGVCPECWYSFATQQSANLFLQAGRRYYIEALQVSGNGDDALAVGWKLPDGTLEQPIPGSRLWAFGLPATTPPVFTSQPANATVLENATAIFRVGVSNLDVVSYQWQRNGANLPGALGATYTIALAGTNDNGASFHCILSNSFGTNTSADAVLAVVPDTTRPAIFSVANLTSNTVQVIFSEPVEPASATNISNYSVNNGVTITAAAFGPTPRIINLTTSPLLQGANYTLAANNVRDQAAARNTITPDSQQTFTVLLKGIYREVFTDIPGSDVADLQNSSTFPNSPARAELLTSPFEVPSLGLNNYGQRLRARLIPPVTGNYTFWVAADDTAILFLGANETPAGAQQIASVTAASLVSPRQWDVQANQKSAVISLVAGQQYYIEALMKDGIAVYVPVDHLAVRWQLPDGSFEEPIPVTRLIPYGLNPPLITSQPTNLSAVEATAATFTVAVSNVDPINFQWQQNGTNIPGATNAAYTDSFVRLAESGSIFQCVLSNPMGSTNTHSAILNVTPDVTPPAIRDVLNNSSNRVVVFFSEPVDAFTATNPANYGISGAIVSAAALRGDHLAVTLTTSPLTTGSAYLLTVNGVRDLAATPNTIPLNSQWTFLAQDLFPQDIGSPPLPGSVSYSEGGVNVVGSGSGAGGASDQFNYSYQQQRGNFDVKVRVQRLDFSDPWTAAGLMVREDLGANSRFAAVFSTPSVAGAFFQYRATTGGIAQVAGSFPANYPNTWLRLQRGGGGDRFTGYASYDGQTWTQLGTISLPMGATVYLGFAVASHNPSQATAAQFRDFSDATGGAVALLPVATEPIGPSSRRTPLAISEIMYHPAPRTDGLSVEFIELYNSNPFLEDISGYRISGDVSYTFPAGTILPGGAFLVVAHNPADIQAVYGISNVTGPYTKSLSNAKGTVRLRNRADAIMLEVNYDSKPPWPLAADGAGHSLVLARPSYGEGDAKAWAQSGVIGGSPGTVDALRFEPLRKVMINEFLANSTLPDVDYIELYNHSAVPVDLSGCWLSDSPGINKFRVPDGTVIGPTGFVYFTESDFNPTPGTNNSFALSAAGEAIYFVSSNLTWVIDSLSFGAQETGVSTGRSPDGAPAFSRLAAKTPGAPNAPLRNRNIVINEIMHHPVTEDDNDQFLELYNRGTNAVSLANWQFISGISFTFSTNAVIAPNGYLVIAKNAAHLMTNYPNLTITNTVGDFGGALGHSGDTIALAMPDTVLTTNLSGVVKTNINYIVVEETSYGKGGKWGPWNDGGGSSLELIDPHSDNRIPSNWADSDDTAKSVWTTITGGGTLDNADGSSSLNNSFQLYLLDVGECLVDGISVSIAGSGNLVTNADFENGLNNWVIQGDHMFSRLENTGFASAHSLRLVADNRGDPVANRVYTLLTQNYTTNITGTISAKVKWLHGTPNILLRLRGNHLDLPGVMTIPHNLGTPGARNSRYATNAGPAITEVIHNPVLPAANQPVVVTARVQDPDGIASVQCVYRIDPFGASATAPMVDDGTGGDAVAGDGIYSGTIPGQASDALVAFYVQAADGFAPSATSRFPSDAPVHECLVHFGDSQPFGAYGSYRFWLTRASYNQWVANPKLSNEGNPGTFVYGNSRVIYNATDRFGGSPFHAPLLDTPDGTNCDYYVEVASDDKFLNANSFTLQTPGNFGRDATGQNEQTAYWMAKQLGLPYLYRRSVNVFFNGIRRGFIYEDTQQPDGDYGAEFCPNSAAGDLYKIQYDFETTDDTTGHATTPASLQEFLTAGGVKKLARYRQTFTKRAVNGSPNDYTNLFNLVDTLNTPATGDAYVAQVFSTVDIKEWMDIFALERLFNNTDLYGNQKQSGAAGGQNAYTYKPDGDTWKFYMWDVDFCFSGLPTDPLFNFTDPPISNLCAQPSVLRIYWQALEDEANGPWAPANAFPTIDAKYNAYLASDIAAGPPTAMKNFISARHDYVLQLIADQRADFGITSNGGTSFTNLSTLATLSGSAPFSVRDITINGVSYLLSWTSITNWSVQLPLTSQTNQFVVQPYDGQGNALSNITKTIAIYFNGPISRPEDSLVISEIMCNPAVSNASYVEIYNRSTNTTFGLLNYRLQGLSFDFAPGTIINPQSFLVVVKDPVAFQTAYGTAAPIGGTFTGNLNPGGETLTLIKQALTTNDTDLIIDKVRYDSLAPWPAAAAVTNSGVALQLIDLTQDNARVSNWSDGSSWQFFSFTGKPNSSTSSKLYLYLDGAGDVYIDDVRIVLDTVPAVGSNYVRNSDFEAPLSSPWLFAGSSGANNSTVSSAFAHSGSNSLHLIFTKAGSTSACLYQDFTSGFSFSTSSNYTVSFWYRSTPNANNLTARFGNSSSTFTASVNVHSVPATPGAANWVAGTLPAYPLLWINEVQPNNFSGLQDNTGAPQPWLELFNSGTNTIALDGFFLANNYTNLNQWAFPTGTLVLPGQFRVIFADGQPQLSTGTVLHTSFRLAPTNGSVALSRGQLILDYLNYTNMEPDLSYGSYPDGQLFDRQVFYFLTPGASNNPAPVPVAINEWMASNTHTLQNPGNAYHYDDWFELYNFGSATINLSGYYLTDILNNKNMWRIPNGSVVAPHSFLFCWADGNATGTNTSGNALHANFQLSKKGDAIGLFSPGGLQVDAVSFGAQFSDVSQGRYPDGNVNGVYYLMPTATPRTNNVITNNIYSPVLSALSDYTIDEGALLSFIAHATDADTPAQTLTYSLLPGAPDGASINPLTGLFTWTPLETQGGASYPITIQASDNGAPPLSDTKIFTVTVNEVNSPPSISAITDQTIDPNTNLSLTIPALDSDLPPQTLTYALLVAPTGASVYSTGLFTWTPTQAQASSTNPVVVAVTDTGVPPLSATQSFTVFVTAGNPCTGWMADVAPRTNGDGKVDISDWVQVGLFAANLAVPASACEFTKAHCAPGASGDRIMISDWVQAGLYSAHLAPLLPVGTPGSPGGPSNSAGVRSVKSAADGTLQTLIATNMVVERGHSNCLPILLQAQGNENALGFSLSFDTNLLTYVSSKLGSGAVNSDGDYPLFNRNTSGASTGRVGFALALPAGTLFSPGLQEIVIVCFRAAAGAEPVSTTVAVGDDPIPLQLVNVDASSLRPNSADGTVILTSGAASAFQTVTPLGGGQLKLGLIGAPAGVWELQGSSDLTHWDPISTVTNTTGILEVTTPATPNQNQRFYRAVQPPP